MITSSYLLIFHSGSSSGTFDEDVELSSTAFTVLGSNDFLSLPMPMFNLSKPLIELKIQHIVFLLELYLFNTFIVPRLGPDCKFSHLRTAFSRIIS